MIISILSKKFHFTFVMVRTSLTVIFNITVVTEVEVKVKHQYPNGFGPPCTPF